MRRPEVDILVVTWNGGEHLKKCVAAIRRHTGHWPYRLHVFCNGSTDGTDQWLKRQKDALSFFSPVNLGVTKATNRLLKKSRAQWIVRLGDDSEVTPGWLDRFFEGALQNPRIGIVGSRGVSPEGGIEASDGVPGPQNWMWTGTFEKDCGQRSYRKYAELVCGCILLRRTVLETIGLYDEKLSDIGEDTDFGLRSRLGGFLTFYDGSLAIIHHRLRRRRKGRSVKNLNAYRQKWGNYPQFPIPDTDPEDRCRLAALRFLVRGLASSALKILSNFKTDSRSSTLSLLKGLALIQLGKDSKAASILRPLTVFSARAEYILGVFAFQRGRRDMALSHFRRALDLSPVFGPAYAGLFEAHVRSGRLRKAEETLVQGSKYCQDQTILRWCLARLQHLQGKTRSAHQIFSEIPAAMDQNSNEWLYPEF